MIFAFTYQIDYMATDGEGLLGHGCGFEGYAGRGSLPRGRGAGGVGSGRFHFSVSDFLAVEELLQNRFAAIELRDDGVDFLAIVGNAAIGGVVTIPTGRGVEGIELGKIDGRDVAGRAVDQQPSAALPLPVRRWSRRKRREQQFHPFLAQQCNATAIAASRASLSPGEYAGRPACAPA